MAKWFRVHKDSCIIEEFEVTKSTHSSVTFIDAYENERAQRKDNDNYRWCAEPQEAYDFARSHADQRIAVYQRKIDRIEESMRKNLEKYP